MNHGANFSIFDQVVEEAIFLGKPDIIRVCFVLKGVPKTKIIGFLQLAISLGDIKIVKELLLSGNVDSLSDNYECLYLAYALGHTRIAQFLLQGFRLNYSHEAVSKALVTACENGSIQTVKLLTSYGVDIHYQADLPLRTATQVGNLLAVQHLLEIGANASIMENNPLSIALANNHFEIADCLIKYGASVQTKGNSFLIKYSKAGDLSAVAYLLGRGADIHAQNDLAFKVACLNGKLNITAFLLAKGVSVNSIEENSLEIIINRGYYLTAKLLISKGANISYGNYYIFGLVVREQSLELVKFIVEKRPCVLCVINNAFLESIYTGNTRIISYLLDHGANIHFQNDQALLISVEEEQYAVAQLLLSRGADVDSADRRCITTAIRRGSYDLVRMLLKHGGYLQQDDPYPLNQGFYKNKTEQMWDMTNFYKDPTEKINFSLKFTPASNDQNAQSKQIFNTPVYTSAKNGHAEAVKILLQHSNNSSALVESALYGAVENGNTELMEYLFGIGAKSHVTDSQIFASACKSGNLEMIRSLLKHGASIYTIRDDPLRAACEMVHPDIAKYFLGLGGDQRIGGNISLKPGPSNNYADISDILRALENHSVDEIYNN
ncbi:hypothetical protein BB560_002283 [Smittium megazygosporum]|uniref:Ankyrin repeat protein n=1 Tax=Smittium megazygosporum TaxID=133381 RepID=A0A2T9ZF62_9FUNG|nr:hypothetical protein BB560_002283 [Smittium megazygosporum]